jgi:hypothetical protein
MGFRAVLTIEVAAPQENDPAGLERETEKVGATVIHKQAVTQNVATNHHRFTGF